MQLDARLGQEKLPDHFQLDVHLVGIEGFPEYAFKMVGQGPFADIEAVRKLLPGKKGLRRGLDQAGYLLCQGVRSGRAFLFFLLFQERAEEKIEKKRQLLLFQGGTPPAFRDDLLKERADAWGVPAVDQAGENGGLAGKRIFRKGRRKTGGR